MGEFIESETFSPQDYAEFHVRLEEQLGQLRQVLRRPAFARQHFSIGSELEVCLVDDDNLPAAVNEEVLDAANDPVLSPELNRYNLEINLPPASLPGDAFGKMEAQMRSYLQTLQGYARDFGANVVPVGILPTLTKAHFNQQYLTDRVRYRALQEGLCGENNKRYRININGQDHLMMEGEGVTVEGANTSFQVHLRIPADRFADYFNAAQWTTPLALALSSNSPLIVGHRLWQESRIALFKQSVDFRDHEGKNWRLPSRVNFGQGWVREGAWELFAESVALFHPLLPFLYDKSEDSPPVLPELRLHHGTIWPWNRAIYSPVDDGHVRIEVRFLPAGPSVVDMVANAALALGWIVGLGDTIDERIAGLPFRFAEYNFYRSAQYGLEAKLIWPAQNGSLEERPIVEVIEELLPMARQGLEILEMDKKDLERYWGILCERLDKRATGAAWQLCRFEHYRKSASVEESCRRMLADYRQNVKEGTPVAKWN